MKINEIISENFAGAFASVVMPMTPGTKKKDAKKSVYGETKKKKHKMGYSADVGNLVYNIPVKSQMIKR
jgi:hypothetical protein